MLFLKNIQVGIRLVLTTVLMACLSGSAFLTCWESGAIKEICTCESLEAENNAHEVKFDSIPELESSFFTVDFSSLSSWGIQTSEPFHPTFLGSPLSANLGLNYPPPEA